MNLKKFCYVTTRIVKILLVSLAVAIPLVCALVYTKNATENWSNTAQIGTYWLPEKYQRWWGLCIEPQNSECGMGRFGYDNH